jgi:hypothetical protein
MMLDLQAQQDFAPAVSWANFDPEGNGAIVLSELFDTPRRLTREQAGKLSLQDVRSIQGEYMLRAGELLAQNPEDKTDSPACQLLKVRIPVWRSSAKSGDTDHLRALAIFNFIECFDQCQIAVPLENR